MSIIFAQKVQLSTNATVQSFGDPMTEINGGLGNVATLIVLLKLLGSQQLQFESCLLMDDDVIRDVDPNQIFFERNEHVSAYHLLGLMLATSDPIVALAICRLVQSVTKKKMSQHYYDLDNFNEVKEALANQTGRVRQSVVQHYNNHMLQKLVRDFVELPESYRDLLHQTDIVNHEKYYYVPTMSVKNGWIKGGFFFGARNGDCFAFDSKFLYLVTGARGGYERDVALSALVLGTRTPSADSISSYPIKNIVLNRDKAKVTLMGDVYPGEFYSDRRIKRNRWDPLVEEGYDYSFEKLRKYLLQNNLNIFNLETALVKDRTKSFLWRVKKFVLGGDPVRTLSALKKAKLNVALMANNHGGDYGEEGILNSIRSLDKVSIDHVGAGKNVDSATNPIRIETQAKTISLFNAYWYNDRNYRVNEFYPLAIKSGVAAITSTLVDKIMWERQHYPANLIIVSPHWGVDFLPVQKKQRLIAEKLIAAGADLIVGHGSHALQSIEFIDSKPVMYGVGNAFFNSDGEFSTHRNALPYGGIVEIEIDSKGVSLGMRFIDALNGKTKFQPEFVGQEAFSKVLQGLKKNGSELEKFSIDEKDCSLKLHLA